MLSKECICCQRCAPLVTGMRPARGCVFASNQPPDHSKLWHSSSWFTKPVSCYHAIDLSLSVIVWFSREWPRVFSRARRREMSQFRLNATSYRATAWIPVSYYFTKHVSHLMFFSREFQMTFGCLLSPSTSCFSFDVSVLVAAQLNIYQAVNKTVFSHNYVVCSDTQSLMKHDMLIAPLSSGLSVKTVYSRLIACRLVYVDKNL